MLHTNTIDRHLFKVLRDLSDLPELEDFCLVGGTSLALQVGHRKSDDLDFFTDKSFSVQDVKKAIASYSPSFQMLSERSNGIGFLLPLEETDEPLRKVDIYNWGVKFIRPHISEGKIKLASLEDIAGFKLEAICSRKEKKDYVDIGALLRKFTFAEMMGFYREKYPYADRRVVLSQITDVKDLEKSKDPVMLIEMNTKQAVAEIEQKVKEYSKDLVERQLSADKERDEQIQKLLKQKRTNEQSQEKKNKPKR
jgi:hypothetical protein